MKIKKRYLFEKFKQDSDPVSNMGIGMRANISKWMKKIGYKDTDDNALAQATKYEKLDFVKFLVSKGADIHAYNNYAVRHTSERGHFEIVKFLVNHGANIHADNNYALRWASYHGHLKIVKFLVSQGADIHAWNAFALRYASRNGHLEVVKFLVSQGANIHAENNEALRWAKEKGHIDIVKFLESQMKKDKGIVKESLLEKFKQDSDPIFDMGIGMPYIIKKGLKGLINLEDLTRYTNDIDTYKHKILTYFIVNYNKINLDKYQLINVIKYLLNNNYKFFDIYLSTSHILNKKIINLIKNEAIKLYHTKKFNSPVQKLYFIKRFNIQEDKKIIQSLIDSLISISNIAYKIHFAEYFQLNLNFSSSQKLYIGLTNADLILIKEALKEGAKIKALHSLFKTASIYYVGMHKKNYGDVEKILNYLSMMNDIGELEKFIHPNYINNVKNQLKIKQKNQSKRYPRGYKIYRLLKYVNENKIPNDPKYLIKFLFDITHGKDTFNSIIDANYWIDGLDNIVFSRIDVLNGFYILNIKGKEDLFKFEQRFKNIKIDSYI